MSNTGTTTYPGRRSTAARYPTTQTGAPDPRSRSNGRHDGQVIWRFTGLHGVAVVTAALFLRAAHRNSPRNVFTQVWSQFARVLQNYQRQTGVWALPAEMEMGHLSLPMTHVTHHTVDRDPHDPRPMAITSFHPTHETEGAWHGGTGQHSPFWEQNNCRLKLSQQLW